MDDVRLTFGTEGLMASELGGFFVGWPVPPDLDRRVAILRAANEVIVARDAADAVVGFITAITDGLFCASIPLVEVLPESQRMGVGSALVRGMLERLQSCYMIDLACDDDLVKFYERMGGMRLNPISWRNYERLT